MHDLLAQVPLVERGDTSHDGHDDHAKDDEHDRSFLADPLVAALGDQAHQPLGPVGVERLGGCRQGQLGYLRHAHRVASSDLHRDTSIRRGGQGLEQLISRNSRPAVAHQCAADAYDLVVDLQAGSLRQAVLGNVGDLQIERDIAVRLVQKVRRLGHPEVHAVAPIADVSVHPPT